MTIQKTHLIIPNWPAPPPIKAVTTTRRHPEGYGQAAFNLGYLREDETHRRKVITHRQALIDALLLPAPPQWLTQVHGNTCVDLNAFSLPRSPEADAAFTTQKGQVCAVLTADCLPLLLCDKRGEGVAAIHGGWRSLQKGIIENTVQALNLPGHRLLAWLGPAIGPHQFEVGDDVKDAFLADCPEDKDAFLPHKPGKWMANIYALASKRLIRQGVSHIYGGNFCTITEKNRFFSHRREGSVGRQATLIWMT